MVVAARDRRTLVRVGEAVRVAMSGTMHIDRPT
jgi:hypothetical protein